MAKNTKKTDALEMFKNTSTVKPKVSRAKVEEKKETEKKSTKSEPEKQVKVIPTAEEQKQVEKNIESPNIEPEKQPLLNINLDMKPKARNGSAKTYYITYENEEKLRKNAEKNKVSTSEYLNFLLAQIL